ncbi:IS110 family transposase [soil metagenome]
MADRVRLAGIDVSKEKLDVYVMPSGESRTVDYDPRGLARLRRWLVGLGVAVVAVEASGGYEREVSEVLEEAGLVVHRLNPLRVRRFAQLKGRLAKTDSLDARTIAEFACAYPQERQLRRDPRRERLAEHLLVRRHTQEAILDCINQLEHLRDGQLRRLVTARKASMERVLAKLDRCLAELIARHADLAELSERLRTVPAVGPILATTLIALLPELGSLTRRQVASLVGVAHFDRSSGRKTGAKSIQAGRGFVRKVLYMAAMVASRHNPVIAAFAQRLAGKPGKVRLVACMRKLIVTLNAIVRDGAQWQPLTA